MIKQIQKQEQEYYIKFYQLDHQHYEQDSNITLLILPESEIDEQSSSHQSRVQTKFKPHNQQLNEQQIQHTCSSVLTIPANTSKTIFNKFTRKHYLCQPSDYTKLQQIIFKQKLKEKGSKNGHLQFLSVLENELTEYSKQDKRKYKKIIGGLINKHMLIQCQCGKHQKLVYANSKIGNFKPKILPMLKQRKDILKRRHNMGYHKQRLSQQQIQLSKGKYLNYCWYGIQTQFEQYGKNCETCKSKQNKKLINKNNRKNDMTMQILSGTVNAFQRNQNNDEFDETKSKYNKNSCQNLFMKNKNKYDMKQQKRNNQHKTIIQLSEDDD